MRSGPISPLLFGSNTGPWSAVPFDLMDEARAARITMLRFDTGEKIWSYLVGSPVRAAVAVVDGWIIAVAVDGGVYAFGEAP